ncbi:deacetylase [Acidihalobacter yilgarnensis]|uniref:Deacetylase n=1 Tax=Acidihalobacter yilgarnensis TaxID=2819280 RepID=A0A1D8ISI8_9GAMM|nr:histone deacetylase family protein [Acidihalobacter yilgarnensis]AOU99373.1 deacetylase [Acidihalobacter yilgarnensis]
MSVLLISHPTCRGHDPGHGHPESPARLGAIGDQLIASGLDGLLHHLEAPAATREQLLRVHTGRYLDALEAARPEAGHAALDPDTALSPGSLEAARHAAGAVVMAVDRVIHGDVRRAFCAVRPPGHHAEPARAMGFCLYNNIAVGTAHALAVHGLARVAIVDFDVHHGNGTEAVFRDEPRVLLCSTFEHPLYPDSGADTQSAHIVNVPLPAGTDGASYRRAFEARILPALEAFKPELLMVSAGFDGHREDPLAHLTLVEDDYDWITRRLIDLAERHCGGRLVSALEGGYALPALGRSVAAHVKALLEYAPAQRTS